MKRIEDIKLSDLTDYETCMEARDGIYDEPRNVVGGMAAWCSGFATDLTSAAQRKVDAIERKMEKLADAHPDGGGAEGEE